MSQDDIAGAFFFTVHDEGQDPEEGDQGFVIGPRQGDARPEGFSEGVPLYPWAEDHSPAPIRISVHRV